MSIERRRLWRDRRVDCCRITMLRSPSIEVLSFITHSLRSMSVAVSVMFVVSVFLHHLEDEAAPVIEVMKLLGMVHSTVLF
jgi:hypothetical protein